MEIYKISKVYLKNFKLIDEAFISFNNEDLVVLDGPNGFGKTTIFDALELVLTGNISRIENYNKQSGYKTLLFSKYNNKETIVKIEFSAKNNNHTFVKRYTPQKNLNKKDRSPDNWELFNTYKLNTFDSDMAEAEEILQNDINESLGINEDLGRLYNLFYYIQQEDNTRFLKQPGKQRMEAINHLFDTQIQQKEQEKLSNVRQILMKEKRKVSGEKGQSGERLNVYKGLTTSEVDKNEMSYIPLLSNNSDTEWDKEDLEIGSKEQRDKYIAELTELEDFRENFDEFIKSIFNKELDQVASKEGLLESIIISSNFIDDFEEIEKKYKRQQMLIKKQKQLKKENLIKNIKEINFNKIREILNVELNIDGIEQIKESIISQQNSASELSKIVKDLNDTREKLLDHFNHVRDKIDDKHGECPLCGYDWIDYGSLSTKIESKRKLFLQYYDNATEIKEKKVDELYEKYINSILAYINNELEKSTIIKTDFFRQIKNVIKNSNTIDIIKRFQGWCHENNIDYQTFENSHYNQPVTDIKNNIKEFSDHISSQKKRVKDGYSESDDKFKQFEILFQNTFQKSEENVRIINKESIKQKKRFIDYLFYRHNSNLAEKERRILRKLEELEKKLVDNISALESTIKVYDDEIKKHWNKIMTDIEIPFYIYSGKITQEYQMGSGIFIEESPDGKAKNIKFVSDNEYDHDAINYLSSGQLSALVISFTLALNKVYGNKALDIILIDDPVQTMDEINMASFTELLRNEFSHKQIIISTHEEDVSRYLRYKFKKYDLNAMRFNVKDQLMSISY